MPSVHMSDAGSSREPSVRDGRAFDLRKVDKVTLDVLAKIKAIGRYVQHFLKGMPRAYQNAYGEDLILKIVKMKRLIMRSAFMKYGSYERQILKKEVDDVLFDIKVIVDDAYDNSVCQDERYDKMLNLIGIAGKAIGGWLKPPKDNR